MKNPNINSIHKIIMKKNLKTIALLLVFSLLLTSTPIPLQAKWRDMSSNLPGYSNGPDPALALVVGGIVVAGGIYAIIKVRQHKKKIDAINKAAQSSVFNPTGSSFSDFSSQFFPEKLNLSLCPETDIITDIQNTAQKLPIDVFFAPVSFSEKFDLTKTNGMQIGITIKF